MAGKTLRNTVVALQGRADAGLTKAAQDAKGTAGFLVAVKSGASWSLASDAAALAPGAAVVDAISTKDGTTKVGERRLNTAEYLARLQADGLELVQVADDGAVSALRYVEEDL